MVMILLNEQGNRINLPLATRRGSQIPNEVRNELSEAILNAAKADVSNQHPDARLRSLRSSYNCLGMVFACRRVWVNPEHLGMILREDGYRRVMHESELQQGDVVVYRDSSGEVSHVGLVAEVNPNIRDANFQVTVLSQWGATGEYFHRVDDVTPILGHFSEYWTERL